MIKHMVGRVLITIVVAAVITAGNAWAHPLDVTFTTADIQRSEIQIETRITARQAAVAFLERENDFTPEDITEIEPELLGSYNDAIEWRRGESVCPRQEQAIHYDKDDVAQLLLNAIVIRSRYVCPDTAEQLTLHNTLFGDDFPDQRNIFVLASDTTQTQYVFTPQGTEAFVESESGTVAFAEDAGGGLGLWGNLGRFIWLGIEHVAIGFDHILFMVGIYLVVRKPRELLTVITSFTVAHSITLILATLGVVRLPSAPVEAAIAATIVYIGIENIVRKKFTHRALVTFGLGLIHGLGFASVLREIGIPKQYLIADLIGFNVGVELGQLAIVAVLLPLIWFLSRRPKIDRVVVYAASIVISAIGLVWFLQRIGQI